jgi:hypothetical protein
MNDRNEMKVVSNHWKFVRSFPRIGNSVRAIAAVIAVGFVAASAHAQMNTNLIKNGSFDDGLNGWRYKYNLPGESWYNDNEKLVSVVARESGRVNVLSLKCNYDKAMVPGQGVQVDSFPIPVDVKSGARWRLTVSARTTAPDCRIYLQGYKWKPGIKPHDNPDLSELRREYKFAQVYFSTSGKGGAKQVGAKTQGTLTGKKGAPAGENEGSGDFGGVKGEWRTGSVTLPDEKMTDLAKSMYEQIKFLSLHVIAIGSSSEAKNFQSRDDCYLYVDDIKLERIK